MLPLHKEKLIQYIIDNKKWFSRNIWAPLVIHKSFITYLYTKDIYDTEFQLHSIYLEKKLYNKTKKAISVIYVSITVSLLQFIYIYWYKYNIQYSMLDHPYNWNISIYSYFQETLLNFMLEIYAFITSSLTLVYLKLIVEIQC